VPQLFDSGYRPLARDWMEWAPDNCNIMVGAEEMNFVGICGELVGWGF
jgi:hypothetical protein